MLDKKKNIAPGNFYVWLVAISAVASVLFRGVLGLFYPVSLNSLVWDETILTPVANFFGLNFGDLSSLEVTNMLSFGGSLYAFIMVCFGLAIGVKWFSISRDPLKEPQEYLSTSLRWMLPVSSILVLFVCLLKVVGRGFNPLIAVEWASQIGSCLIFLMCLRAKSLKKSLRLAELCVALTFIGHGLFALGWPYAVPSHFIDMFVSFFGTSEVTARELLLTVGVLDMFVGVALIVGFRSRLVLSWAIIWGAATALARTAVMVMPNSFELNTYWIFETLVRLPHFLLPVAVFVCWGSPSAEVSAKE